MPSTSESGERLKCKDLVHAAADPEGVLSGRVKGGSGGSAVELGVVAETGVVPGVAVGFGGLHASK